MGRYESVTTTGPNHYLQSEKVQNSVTVHSHVTVPALSASGIAAMAGLFAYRLGAETDALVIGAVVWLLTFVGWEVMVIRYSGTVERTFGIDLDGDGRVGPQRHVTRIEATFPSTPERGTRTIFPEFGLHPSLIEMLFRAALADDACREAVIPCAQWTGDGRPLSEPEWKMFTAALRDAGLIEYRGGKPQAGHVVTDEGRAVMQQWLAENGA